MVQTGFANSKELVPLKELPRTDLTLAETVRFYESSSARCSSIRRLLPSRTLLKDRRIACSIVLILRSSPAILSPLLVLAIVPVTDSNLYLASLSAKIAKW